MNRRGMILSVVGLAAAELGYRRHRTKRCREQQWIDLVLGQLAQHPITIQLPLVQQYDRLFRTLFPCSAFLATIASFR